MPSLEIMFPWLRGIAQEKWFYWLGIEIIQGTFKRSDTLVPTPRDSDSVGSGCDNALGVFKAPWVILMGIPESHTLVNCDVRKSWLETPLE